jgi:hypothetical protein
MNGMNSVLRYNPKLILGQPLVLAGIDNGGNRRLVFSTFLLSNSFHNEAMTPASRTPEGEPNQCPICGREVRLEPSRPPGDAPCSYCGHLLWFDSSERPESLSLKQTITFSLWTQQVAQVSDDRYFEELLSGLVGFMAAKAGIVWIPTNSGLTPRYQHRDAEFPESLYNEERRRILLRHVAADGRASLSQPSMDSGTSEDLLLAVPLKQEQEIRAIVEIVQGPGASIKVQQTNLRYLELICGFAHDRICELAAVESLSPATLVADVPAKAIIKKRWWEVWK